MEMMMNVGMGKLAIADDSMEKRRGHLVKVVCHHENCRVCSKDGVRHLDTDCWKDDRNADK